MGWWAILRAAQEFLSSEGEGVDVHLHGQVSGPWVKGDAMSRGEGAYLDV